jgi:hypothetical protein
MRLVHLETNFHRDGSCVVSTHSILTGKPHTMTMRMTRKQFERWDIYGDLIQDALPQLSPSEREFLLTGSTDAEFKAVFGDE